MLFDHDLTKARTSQMFTASNAAIPHDSLSAIAGTPVIDRENASQLLTGSSWVSKPKPDVARGEGRPARIWDSVQLARSGPSVIGGRDPTSRGVRTQ